ncbi:hypothetical protein ACN47E_010065 [Coniothyrium glycines]
MERIRATSHGNDPAADDVPLIAYDPPTGYNSGDIAMQGVDAPYSPPMLSPDYMDTKAGAYATLNSASSTFDSESGGQSGGYHHHHLHPQHHNSHHVKRFDHNTARRKLLMTGLSRLMITIFFSAALCITLRSWEGWGKTPVVLGKIDVRIFNSLTIGLSLCLGLNILASLKQYASTFRWAFLSSRYVSLEVFDLILHLASLAQVTKLMILSAPGIRGNSWLRRFRMFKNVRDDGTKWMWLACLLWLSINISSQVLVALLSLFWPMSNSEVPLLTRGTVITADLRAWYHSDELVDVDTVGLANATSLETAWMFGIQAMDYPVFDSSNIQNDISSLAGVPVYRDTDQYHYRFYNRDAEHQYTNYLASSRNVTVTATCDQLELNHDGEIISSDKEGDDAYENGQYIEGRKLDTAEWTRYRIPEAAGGSITWIASVQENCGARCTNFTVLQYETVNKTIPTSLFVCTNELSKVTQVHGNMDVTLRSDEDRAAVYGNDEFARIAAGAIGWTGIPWNNWEDRQTRSYSLGSRWSPTKKVSTREIQDMLMRFTIGAVAAFDDHGVRFHMAGQTVVPAQGQQLDVDWSYIFSILGGICGIQFAALIFLVVFANRTIVRDDSFFSIAMLLSPVVNRIGQAGMVLSGDEIKDHDRLKWKKIRYDYREGKKGEPNQVDIFFEGKDQKEGRKSWAPGSYS